MNILVTGGSGFLGKHLCRDLIRKNHTVKVLDLKPNNEFETIIGSVTNQQTVSDALLGIDAVFHLAGFIEAGESVHKPMEFCENNILGTVTLLEEMRKKDIKTFIFSSSAAVYGEPLRTPIKEDDRTLPINPYGMTKLAMEGLASSYSFSHKFRCVALRYFNLYGPGEDHVPETHAIPRFVEQIHTGAEVTIWGNGEHQRDFVYISDVVDAHIASLDLEDAKFHYLNLSGQNATKVIDIIHLIEEIMEKKANIKFFEPRLGDPLVLYADSTKAKSVLGWQANTKLRDGLKITIDDLLSRKMKENKK